MGSHLQACKQITKSFAIMSDGHRDLECIVEPRRGQTFSRHNLLDMLCDYVLILKNWTGSVVLETDAISMSAQLVSPTCTSLFWPVNILAYQPFASVLSFWQVS
jgi:hypothetical protein